MRGTVFAEWFGNEPGFMEWSAEQAWQAQRDAMERMGML